MHQSLTTTAKVTIVLLCYLIISKESPFCAQNVVVKILN